MNFSKSFAVEYRILFTQRKIRDVTQFFFIYMNEIKEKMTVFVSYSTFLFLFFFYFWV